MQHGFRTRLFDLNLTPPNLSRIFSTTKKKLTLKRYYNNM